MNDFKLISDPIELFTAWGLCTNLSRIIWNRKTLEKSSNKNFEIYTQQIDKTINFQCVIMARYDWGVLFIDTCDSATWEIPEIKENHIYLKLQFDPSINYQNNVKPFTYIVNDPLSFHSNLIKYRELYNNCVKTNLTYGRWIGVSLSRFNLAKKMRSIGIMNGGEYCTTPKGTGYDDHEEQNLLDFIKPRERMSWSEYFKNQCFAMSSLDAPGFGDFTHRMIESFGIGIPLIRPKIKNITLNSIIENEHYLDCGENGENLEECLSKIMNTEYRQYLSLNAMKWYEDNASPVSFYNLLLKIINSQSFESNNPIKRYEHIYQKDNFGEDWFSYPELYKSMVEKFSDNSHFVEIGSWKGKSTAYMAVEIANSNKKIQFDCVDTWHGSPEHGDVYKDNDNLYHLFLDNMSTLTDYYKPIRMRSDEAYKIYPDNSLDFVFIDANHSYESVKEDIINWLPKVKTGGVLAGHDYTIYHPGVVRAVDELFDKSLIISKYDCWIYYK